MDPTSSSSSAATTKAAQGSPLPTTGASSLANQVIGVAEFRADARAALVGLLDQVKGKKDFVLDPKLSGLLDLVSGVSVLKEHGVEKIYLLEKDIVQTASKNIFYVIRPNSFLVGLVANNIRHHRNLDRSKTFTIAFVPRRTVACEKILEEQTVFGDATLLDFPVDLIPFDSDVLSLESEHGLKETMINGDRTSLYHLSQALMKIQLKFGIIPNIKGKGNNSKIVAEMLLRLRKDLGSSEPINTPEIDTLILLDRDVDFATPMMTQLTYEGLIDEFFRINCAFIDLDLEYLGGQTKSGQKKTKYPLNSNDKFYQEIRDLNFSKVGPELNKKARELNANYQERHSAQTVSQIREFTKKLPSLKQEHQSLGVHTAIAEKIMTSIKETNFHKKIEQEQLIVSGQETTFDFLDDCIRRNEPVSKVLRLLCLYSLMNCGIKPKVYESVRQEIFKTYGFHHIITFNNLEKAGFLKKADTATARNPRSLDPILNQGKASQAKSPWPIIRKALKLWVEEDQERDISYAFGGYAPISCRIVQAALKTSGLRTVEEALRYLPGPTFDEVQIPTISEQRGLPPQPAQQTQTSPRNQVVMVCFIGGVTQSEISCLRFLERTREGPNKRSFIVMTTKMINGDTLLEPFIAPFDAPRAP